MKLHKVGALAAVSHHGVRGVPNGGGATASRRRQCAAVATPARAPSRSPSSCPQQGSEKAASDPIINGIKLAVKQAGGAAGGYKIDDPAVGDLRRRAQRRARSADRREQHDQDRHGRDDGRRHRPAQLERRARRRSRSRTAAGLLQCSPANTNPDLTKGDPAKQIRTQAEQLHPRRHHGRRPGPGRVAVHLRHAQEEVRLHHRRHRDLREGRRRCVRDGLRRPAAAPSSSTTRPPRPPRTTSRS